jgi:hypothetical protein
MKIKHFLAQAILPLLMFALSGFYAPRETFDTSFSTSTTSTRQGNTIQDCGYSFPSLLPYIYGNPTCVSAGETTQLCISWSGTLHAARISNPIGFTVLSKNPNDVTSPSHCWTIQVDNPRVDVIYYTIDGYLDGCGWQTLISSYCFANCSGYECA